MMLTAATSLLRKDLQQHAWIALPLVVLTMPAAAIGFVLILAEGGASFVSAGLGLVYYWMPILVLIITRRIIAQEHLDGTQRFLMGLPPPAWLVVLVKLLLGSAMVLLIGVTPTTLILAVASLRELMTIGWFLQLHVQCAAYLLAWFAVAASIAQLGRYRMWVWLSLFLLNIWMVDSQLAWGDLWLAPLSDPFDATRAFIPWTNLATGLAWIIGGAGVTMALGSYRGGSIPAALYGPSSTRDQIAGASAVIGLLLAIEVLPEVGRPEMAGWETFPTVEDRASVRLSAERVRPHAEQLDAALRRLTARLGRAIDYEAVLVPAPRTPLRPLPSTRIWRADDQRVIIRPNHPTSAGFVADALRALLNARSDGQLQHDPDRRWMLDGVALAAAEGEAPTIGPLRAAFAVEHGLTRAALDDWKQVERTFGEDIAAGVAAAGVEALTARLGDPDAGSLLADAVLDQGGDLSRVDAAMRDAWFARLQDQHQQHRSQLGDTPPLTATIWRLSRTPGVWLRWVTDEPVRPETELRVEPLSPVRSVYFTGAEDHRLRGEEGTVYTWADPQRAVDVTLIRYVPQMQGVIISGWETLSP
ncbi:MAG: hypothetical protein AAFV53_27795 [Myxococcota bacterium]